MVDDKISLTKQIRFKIITPENVMELIDIIYEDYQKSLSLFSQKSASEKNVEKEPKFILTLVKPEGESNATSDYTRIKNDKNYILQNMRACVSYTRILMLTTKLNSLLE